ncbi:hypothetical protein [Planococcus sp. YIM B11945]|uniref:hypothetical protein n=1 Tax=Planococcus sp. YIM B11945 TaxID=3435410 RepID=UPI003D7EBCCB
MEPRKNRKQGNFGNAANHSGLSYGVMHESSKNYDSQPNKFTDFLMQSFLFILGGVILCGILYAVVSYT